MAHAKKKAKRAHRTIVFIDETGVYLLPAVVSTWAPIGETPVLHHHLTNEHLSIISAVTPKGDLYFQMQQHAYNSESVIGFLEHLHKAIPGKLLVIWDNATIHKGDKLRQYLAEGAAAWLRLELLPGYAAGLNPDDGIWRYLKYVELKNVCCSTIEILEGLVKTAMQHIQKMTGIVKSTFKEAGLA